MIIQEEKTELQKHMHKFQPVLDQITRLRRTGNPIAWQDIIDPGERSEFMLDSRLYDWFPPHCVESVRERLARRRDLERVRKILFTDPTKIDPFEDDELVISAKKARIPQ